MSQQGQRFRRRALRRGYKVDEVDEFLDRAEATLAGTPTGKPVASRDVHDVVFRVRFGGYDEWQVDMHLDRVERQLAAMEGTGTVPMEARPLPPGPSPRQLMPGEPHGGHAPIALGGRDDRDDYDMPPPRSAREDEPTMIRPGRAAASASVPPPEPAGGAPMGTAPGPRPAPDRLSRSRRQVAREEADEYESFTDTLPPVGDDFDSPSGGFGAVGGGGRYEREQPRYEPEPPPSRYDEPAARYDEPTSRYEPEQGAPRYEPPPSRYESGPAPRPEPRPSRYDEQPAPRYEPEPPSPRYEPEQGAPRYEPAASRYDAGPPAREVPAARFESGLEPGRHGKQDMTAEIPAAESPFGPDDVHRLEELRRTFQVRRFGSGYDPSQVSRLFDAIAATMSGRSTVPVNDSELDPEQFSLVQGGLFEAEVDSALREVRELFSRRGIAR